MKKTIVQILRAPGGGIRKHVVDILENIDQTKFNSIFISNFDESDRDLNYLTQNYNVELFNLPFEEKPSLKDLKMLLKINKILKDKNVNVLHGHGAKGGLYARLLKFTLKARSIYTPHGGSLHRVHGKLKNFLYDFIEMCLSPLTDVFVFESEYSKKMFAKNVFNPGKKAIVNLNGIKIYPFHERPTYHSGQTLKLGSFGLLRHLKGHDIAIRACSILKKRNIPFVYEIFGNGEYYYALKAMIVEYGLEENVFLNKYASDVEQLMVKNDFIIHPSRFESFGYVPIEAMALGVPVIASYEGGLKEVLTKETALINETNSPQVYADILISAYEGKIQLKPLIENGRKRVEENFSLNVMISNLQKIYLQISESSNA